MERRYLSIKECAEYTGFSNTTLYRLSRVASIPCFKIRHSLRFDKLEIDKWINKFKRIPVNEDLLEKN
jgi:excisionase family DNA binding protein